MAKNLSTAFKAHLAGDLLTLALCIRITRTDGTVIRLTNHHADLAFNSETFSADPGFTESDVEFRTDGSVAAFSIDGYYKTGFITHLDLLSGIYDHATFAIYTVNYNSLPSNMNSPYQFILVAGRIGDATIRDNDFTLQCRTLSTLLEQTQGELISPTCRAVFGDSRCGLTLTNFQDIGTLDTITDSYREFIAVNENLTTPDGGGESAGYFTNGILEFTSGDNNGVEREILEHGYSSPDHTFKLFLPTPFAVAPGTTFKVTAGCDKRSVTCKTKFSASNLVNMRAEIFVPGPDVMRQFPES